jgi:hypothetical protein
MLIAVSVVCSRRLRGVSLYPELPRPGYSLSGQILLYDHLLSLDTEINLIWLAKTNSAKVLFLFIRYMVPCAITLYTVRTYGFCLSSAGG